MGQSMGAGFVSIHTHFTVVDKGAVDDLGFTRNGEKLYCREAYVDGKAAVAHLKAVRSLMTALVQGPTHLDEVSVHGPEKELEIIKPELQNAVFYKFVCGMTHLAALSSSRVSAHTFRSIEPTFEILDAAKFQAVAQSFIDKAKKDPAVLWYGWTMTEDERFVFCREAYVDGNAVVKHLEDVGGFTRSLFEGGVIREKSLIFHGPEAEYSVVKPTCDQLQAEYYSIVDGFSKYKRLALQK